MIQESGVKGVVIIEGHVQGLANTRAIGREGIPVIVVSEYNCLARYSKFCNGFFRCPPYLSNEFIDFLINLSVSEGIQGWTLMPSNDHAVFNISQNRDILSNYYSIISPVREVLESIYNKESLIKLCISLDIPVPASWFPQNNGSQSSVDLKYPVLIKGKNGLSFYKKQGKKAFLAVNPAALESQLEKILEHSDISEIYLQNLVPVGKNKPVSFTSFSINGDIKSYWMGIKIREHPVKFGTATYSKSVNIPALLPIAGKLLKRLSFTGVSEIEFILDSRDNEFKLIEVNARTWLWVDMAIRRGINYPLMIYNYLNNNGMDYPETAEGEIEWMHYITDIPYSVLGLLKGYYSAGDIFRSYSRLPQPAVLDTNDLLPSVAEIFLLPLLIFRR